MRTVILYAIIAVTAAVSFAAPSQAGGFSLGFGDGYVTIGGYGNGYGHHHYGHKNKHHYNSDYGYEPTCYIKKIKKWDQWGNVYFKKIKICD
ncbi:hypothetical protein [Pararhizobium antarcticum]|uniref:Sulfur globule protein n=1 Tax=Pararhizobium antarcticum TaxID=1798805 RepID=A0A657LPW8_9HYPH|nr:hypothetical protein [Pararhizobium antarcticum]OJF90098.1 hypothetical protein AX761_23700 [Rhizobium sp. 58]OJF90260.1 hypothetical protein AX760_24305 [Pararhizobium antarcticum]